MTGPLCSGKSSVEVEGNSGLGQVLLQCPRLLTGSYLEFRVWEVPAVSCSTGGRWSHEQGETGRDLT